MRPKILILDHLESELICMKNILEAEGYLTIICSNIEKSLYEIKKQEVDVVIADYRMPNKNGLSFIREVHLIDPTISIIMTTAYGSVETAVQAMKAGAEEFLIKPLDYKLLFQMVQKSFDKRRLFIENKKLKTSLKKQFNFDDIVSISNGMDEVLNRISRVSNSNATVLIRGESGTGKELIAKSIHLSSIRKHKPLIKINCAALPETLLESELFGHVKGAFTGAYQERKGKFEESHTGTIFLDEIGEISLTMQAKLLRVLQEKEFEKVGSNKTIKVDVRIIGATNKNLEDAVKQGSFRKDLYYRLSVFPILIPALRSRREDIPLLINYFVKKFSKENNKKISGITKEVKKLLIKYDYPGNIRELENIIESATIMCRENIITLEDLPLLSEVKTEKELYHKGIDLMTLFEAEKRLIQLAMKKHKGIQTKAARELGISERSLRYRLKSKDISSTLERNC